MWVGVSLRDEGKKGKEEKAHGPRIYHQDIRISNRKDSEIKGGETRKISAKWGRKIVNSKGL